MVSTSAQVILTSLGFSLPTSFYFGMPLPKLLSHFFDYYCWAMDAGHLLVFSIIYLFIRLLIYSKIIELAPLMQSHNQQRKTIKKIISSKEETRMQHSCSYEGVDL